MARPTISLLFPHLSSIVQPLAGEYAGRRSLLERLPFVQGYGVDLGLLVDISELDGGGAIAQVDLGTRRHRNRPLDGSAPRPWPSSRRRCAEPSRARAGAATLVRPDLDPVEVPVGERPALVDVPGYRRRTAPRVVGLAAELQKLTSHAATPCSLLHKKQHLQAQQASTASLQLPGPGAGNWGVPRRPFFLERPQGDRHVAGTRRPAESPTPLFALRQQRTAAAETRFKKKKISKQAVRSGLSSASYRHHPGLTFKITLFSSDKT